MEYSQIIIIAITLIFSAFFSGIEIAFVSANKLHIELQGQKGSISGQILAGFLKKPSNFISTTLVGNNIALVLYGIYMANLLKPWIETWLPPVIYSDLTVLIIQTIISTFIVLITAEFTPKSIFLINPDWLLVVFAPVIQIIYYILFPLVFLIMHLSRFIITRILKLEYSEEKPVFGLTDLNNYIKNNLRPDNQDDEDEVNARIINNALEFKTVKVRECMIPRTELVAVDITESIEELKNEFIDSGHSKVMVYKESIDEIVGYCHSLELFKKPKDIESILNPIIIVPETMLANELMIQFITEHKSVALVVDEFGGTSGIVTMEDIIEEIFGEIQDEHDVEDWIEHQIDSRTFLVSARHEIDYLNDKYNWNIPPGDYDTLGGFILSITEDIPQKDEIVEYGNLIFEINAMEDNRIDIVKVITHETKENGK
jgi:CBS domain containing-hemolysin-like protein